MQKVLEKAAIEAETGRRYELQLRKTREDVKQLHWSNEREVKKAIQAKLRALGDG